MHSVISAIDYYLPASRVTTNDLGLEFPEWPVQRIDAKTGIHERHIAADDECASDLAFQAASNLFRRGACSPDNIDYVLFCSQSPDYILPTTACLLQHRLGIRHDVGALDFNLGCSGFVYGLGLAEGLISSHQASCVLLLTAETYSKYWNPKDRSIRAIFGDGAAATVLCARPAREPFIGPFIYGTDGRGANDFIVPAGGARLRRTNETANERADGCGNIRCAEQLFMNGVRMIDFALDRVPHALDALLAKAQITHSQVGLYVFHQANAYLLEELRKVIGIPEEKFQVTLDHCGNTASSTIPIALTHAVQQGRVREGMLVVVVGFGVGYSWGATLIRWNGTWD
jgi:3-oxoacyl-[acyl-carrier-protein] synthase-3